MISDSDSAVRQTPADGHDGEATRPRRPDAEPQPPADSQGPRPRGRRRIATLADVKSKSDRTQEDEVRYFKVDTTCLGCGLEARVKIDSASRKLRCRECGTVQHMALNGEWKLGPPPIDPTAKSKSPSFLSKLLLEYPVLNESLTKVVAGLVLVGILALVGVRFLFGPSANIPETMIGRAGVVCDGLIQGDDGLLDDVTAGGTWKEAARWHAQVRDTLDRAEGVGGFTADYSLRILYERPEKSTGCMLATFRSPPVQDGDEVRPRRTLFECSLFFVTDSGGQWKLDGERTLKAFTAFAP